MKIQKQFIPLILNGTKRYEVLPFSNKVIDGIYKIKNKYFHLKYVLSEQTCDEDISVLLFKMWKYNIDVYIDNYTLRQLIDNIEHFKSGDGYYFCIYKWEEIEIKEIEIINGGK